MYELSRFFTELANEDRIEILFLMLREKLTVTQISEKLGLSIQETSRHLSRLRIAKLAYKSSDGLYHLTPYGHVSLNLLSNHRYLLGNKKYFLKHSLASLPRDLIFRIGEIENSVRLEGVMKVVRLIEMCTQRSEQQILIMFDQILESILPIIEEKAHSGTQCSCLFSKNYNFPLNFKFSKNTNLKVKVMTEVANFVLVTDDEAVVAFPDLSGRVDYTEVFYARDKNSHKWCSDILNHFWNIAQPL